MKLTAKLAYSQIKVNRRRTLWTLVGITLSTAMITAVFGFAASGNVMLGELMGDNDYYTDLYKATLAGISAVFIAIIVAASVIVVSNAFRVSADQRFSQFGILKSVGATKKQVAASILYEGAFLCAIGIPVGIALGLLVNLIGMQIANYFLIELNRLSAEPLVLRFVLAWPAILLSVVVAFATVLLSAWLPARKAAKTPAIVAIRGVGEVKIKAGQVRSSWLVGKLFGFEGTLASKSLKRSRRNFRATVVSLTVSIVLFIVVGYFGQQMNKMTSAFFPGVDMNVVGEYYSIRQMIYGDNNEILEQRFATIDSETANQVTERLRRYPDATVFGVGVENILYTANIPVDMITPKMLETLGEEPSSASGYIELTVSLIVTDAENYAMLCKRAGVPFGSAILVNQYTEYLERGRAIYAPLQFSKRTIQMIRSDDGSFSELPLQGELAIGNIPDEVVIFSNGVVNIIIPKMDVTSYRWIAKAADADGFTTYMQEVLGELELDEELGRISVMNIEEGVRATRGVGNLVMVFIYGFVGMLTLIGLTNVISTISTNVRSRSREFAVLQSVGLTDGGLKRMLNLESILCSCQSLIVGVPLGVVGSYLVYTSLEMPVELPYTPPWIPIAQCVFGVFAITWIVMRYSASRLRGGSIIEGIRKESV